MKPSRPLLISKIQQVISRILAELERLFHNLHCLDDNGLAGTLERRSPKFSSIVAGASSSESPI